MGTWKERLDGWKNTLIGLSGSQDKTRQTDIDNYYILSDSELRNVWMGDGFGKRIASVIPDDMTRPGFTIPEDADGKITTKLGQLDWEYHFNLALKWGRLFGGGLIVIGVNDGGRLDEPLRDGRIRDIEFLRTYSRDQIEIWETDIIKDPENKRFGEPKVYNIMPREGATFQVHYTRTLVFKGEPQPKWISGKQASWFWGVSYLQAIWDQIRNMGAISQGVANVFLELIIGKFKIKGLANMIASGNEDKVRSRMEIINASKSLINSVLLDADAEDYTRDSANMSGVAEVIDRFMIFLSAVTGIPVTKLFGRSPAGQNATGDSDTANYYDTVDAERRFKMKKPLMYLVELVNKKLKVLPEGYTLHFNPLKQPSEKEIVEMDLKRAQSAQIYVQMGILTGDEIRKTLPERILPELTEEEEDAE